LLQLRDSPERDWRKNASTLLEQTSLILAVLKENDSGQLYADKGCLKIYPANDDFND
jgi:hypothetical protein